MTDPHPRDRGLGLLDALVAEGRSAVSSSEVAERLGLSAQSTSNLLRRLMREGLLDRVSRGRYVIRALGVLGTPAAAEDIAMAVAAAFGDTPHRIAYRSALEELELLVHPSRTIQIASSRRVRKSTLSERPLKVVVEPERSISVGAKPLGPSRVSDIERALLDAAARPELVGGAPKLVEVIAAAGDDPDPARLTSYASRLRWGAALRRVGSIADRLQTSSLTGRLSPLKPPTADLDLEPSSRGTRVWRDSRWWVRWAMDPDELVQVDR